MFLEFNLNLDILYLRREHNTAKPLKAVQDPFHTEAGPGYGTSPGAAGHSSYLGAGLWVKE